MRWLLQRFPPTGAEIAAFQKGNDVISLGKASHAHQGSTRSKRRGPPGAGHFTAAQIQVSPGEPRLRASHPWKPSWLTLRSTCAPKPSSVLIYHREEMLSMRRIQFVKDSSTTDNQ